MVVSVVFVVTLEAEIEDLMPDLMKLTKAAAEAARKTETSTAGGFTRTARELERRRQTVTDQLTVDPVLRCPSTCRAPDLDPEHRGRSASCWASATGMATSSPDC